MTHVRSVHLVLIACLLVFGLPLFLGLGNWEMRNDEAIYSYSVERILDTGDWLTLRYIPTDYEFLEKPPLKMWLVAGLMKLGLTPRDELGMRILDPVFGTIAFAYVFAFGARLAGPLCGAVALLLLFTFSPLIFDHGLRSNTMEAPLFLAYAGGAWHAFRWAEGPHAGRRHAWLVTGYFVLGFMTKYVAALFFPTIVLFSWLWRPGGASQVRQRWREWLWPALFALTLITPWFAYQAAAHGWWFWKELLGKQVYERFTTGVDPTHLARWHYYVSQPWAELQLAGSAWIVTAGASLVLWRAFRRGDQTARLLALWWVVPVPLMSLGSSKLMHYFFPYLPPLALAGGLATAGLLRACNLGAEALSSRADRRLSQTRLAQALWSYRRFLVVMAIGLLAVAAWTFWAGRVQLRIGGVRVFSNSSTLRPALVGVLLLIAVGRLRIALQGLAAIVLLLLLLPLNTYARHLELARSVDRPLATLAACINGTRTDRLGVFVADADTLSHTYFYYLRHLGPWETRGDRLDQIRRRVLTIDPAAQTPVLMHRTTWQLVRAELRPSPAAQLDPFSGSPLDDGLEFASLEVLVVPRAFASCLKQAITAGGHPIAPDSQQR